MNSTRLALVADFVVRFTNRFDPSVLTAKQRFSASVEIDKLIALFNGQSAELEVALGNLRERLQAAPAKSAVTAVRPRSGHRALAMMLRLLSPLAAASTIATTTMATSAFAALPTYTVGQTIVNPQTGTSETVSQLVDNYAVVTAEGHYILLAQTVDDTFTVTDNSVSPATLTTYKVTAVTLTDGRVTGVTLTNLTATPNTTQDIATYSDYTPPSLGGGTGTGVTYATPTMPGTPYYDIRSGGNGGNGRNGGGICFGVLGCIQYAPGDGGDGGTPASFTDTITLSWGAINTTGANQPGIVVVSKGGDGGDGGYGVGNIPPASGGDGGDGGTVTAINQTVVTTAGENSFGMLVQSVGGRSGSGGDCYVACSGGGPGVPGDGGSATGINEKRLTTSGTGAVGLYVQSSGGNSGTGGSSYGIVGDGGSGGYGGNGGQAKAVNNDSILTSGNYAYGVQAQSIGGIGGNSGDAGGIVAFTGSGGGGGHGGTAIAELGGTSSIITEGNWAHGVLVQSIGGGGGSTGSTGGVASFGGSGGDGGYAGTVEVTAADGAEITTSGVGSYGIYAQSIGGTGGTAGGTGGVFTMGGSGGSGKAGGTVTVNSSATIVTTNQDARGIVAQSIGGGGGSANTSGGIVTLGGSGGSGANGGAVTVTLGSGSDIKTSGRGADGVVAQSIGGGGGSGASAVGIVALGGGGSTGGVGNSVTVSNAGSIVTSGRLARGIFAQSIGGGGGSGGDGGGLVSIGGSSSSGGSGGSVTAGNTGLIRTTGDFSQGIFVQSIGGGGGSGGNAVGLATIGGSGSGGGTGGAVTVSNAGAVATSGNRSSAIQAQSIGGGGGDGGTTGGVLVTIGGKGGAGNNGGTVVANISGGMQTTGNDSHGLFAQSVGGGGGNGGSTASLSAFAGVALGGSGGAGGEGGNVDVNFTSKTVTIDGVNTTVLPRIVTTGDRSRGIFAQSVGGGGGTGGFAVQASAGAFGAVSVAIGGKGGAGSKGGNVDVDGNVSILTIGDSSEGLFAQSIGGGGGAGGFAISTALSAGIGFSASLSVGIGGQGGSGGAGGSVDVASGGDIVTEGTYSTGLLAQSIGGGGGKGGFSVSVSGAGSDGAVISAAVGIGGNGGDGGIGGTVNASFDGNISTGGTDGLGSDAAGFVAQSIGGGGGAGGFNVAGTLTLSGGASFGGSVGLGGTGGLGGAGGEVTGHVGGNVQTSGDRSTGIVVQSVGGGGGSGGFNVSGNIAASGGFAGGVAVGLGGTGGGAGDGGTVDGSTDGTVLTLGDQSDGVVIQSVGGGGGSGGFNVSGNLAFGGTAALGVSVGLGGSGGNGGAGGTVTGDVYDTVETWGDQSRGILAQSAGGGGGSGAFNVSGDLTVGGSASGSIGVGLGGSGGGGGNANWVDASARSVTTHGNQSAAFTAQSVGGGGGGGAFNVTGGLNFSGTASGNIGVGLGGSGGTGGSAQWVDAELTGIAVTYGDQSGAIIAQSIGGGGGSGGFNIAGAINASGTGAAGINVGVGGSGGGGGSAGNVDLDVLGRAHTEGDGSDAIFAQSVGGGGGSGAFNITGGIGLSGTGAGNVGVGIGGAGGTGGIAGAVVANVNKSATSIDENFVAATTLGDWSRGIVAQSLGGGGGSGGFNVAGTISGAGTGAGGAAVGIGGSGGGGGNAGTVTMAIKGYTATEGDHSDAVLAQSIGGGGGAGGFNVSGGIAVAGKGAGTVNVGIGGSGGLGGDSAAVTVDINRDLIEPSSLLIAAQTLGDNSRGIVAQSLGGGGGSGGFNVTGSLSGAGTGAGGAAVGIGGSGGGGGDGKAVTADITGVTLTKGNDSDGILAQSIGGGGGAGGFNVSAGASLAGKGAGTVGLGIGGSGGDGGNAGAVNVNVQQYTADGANSLYSVLTEGNDSRGIVAQSLGGGGGTGGFNITGLLSAASEGSGNLGVGVGGGGGSGGNAGNVTAKVNGDIDTRGSNSAALLLQSVGGGGGAGGFNVTGGIALSKELAGNVMVGVGGFGGGGGNAANVDGTLTGDIITRGNGSFGAAMQSLGGGGGAGGFNVAGGISLAMGTSGAGTLGVGIGGFGGDGGNAANVTGSITGNINTSGNDAYGALMQSAGGGGGSGGFNVTGGLSASRGTTGAIGFGLGGFGGGGGNAGAVDGTIAGDVRTNGANSFGAMLQSVGGAGGNGGFNVTGNVSLTPSDNASASVSVGIGGFGGGGGQAGSVTGDVTGLYVTSGKQAAGVIAQSLGGGGGNGGLNISGALAIGTGTTGTGTVGIGGFGGSGGDAGVVNFTRLGDTFTSGAEADGIVVQSLGGGGGRGGIDVSAGLSFTTKGDAASLGFGLGGFGGDGGDGAEVDASVTGNVIARGLTSDVRTPDITFTPFPELSDISFTFPAYRTRSGGSNGVVIQSVGGGGGQGGLNVSGQISITGSSDNKSRVAALGVGGFGGSGGNAGDVTAAIGAPTGAASKIQVQGIGDDKVAVAIQSIGGGGGQGGINVSGGISTSGQLVMGVGGFGGAGGFSGDVIGTVDADLFASGNRATGLLAQSIGGGGGAGGINVSGGIEATKTGTEPSIVFGVGGFGGVGNTAGNVTVTQTGQVEVDGANAHGVLVQSIGGGGGVGGLNVAASLNTGTGESKTDGMAIAGGLGGKGGTGAKAGNVNLTSNGNVLVNTLVAVDSGTGEVTLSGIEFADSAPGVVAQSIGGGGGAGGMNVTGAIAPKGSPIAIGIGGTGGVGGDAGSVTVVRGYTEGVDGETETPGTITTFGNGSTGLAAQSIGGGGGNAGMNFVFAATLQGEDSNNVAGILAVGGDGSAAGNGGNVGVRHNGNILTDGDASAGILAQSIAGGGGNANFNVGLGLVRNATAMTVAIGGGSGNGGTSGNVTVDHTGYIETKGDQSNGITAQSLAGGGGNAAMNMAPALLAKNKLQIGIGREGGTGGTAGNVLVNTAGAINTNGMDSSGVLAQSIGGAGGSSGSISISGSGRSGSGDNAQSFGASFALGLEGGAGGKSGTVTVVNQADIGTKDDRSRGIVAQSIGGEGGMGGGVTNIIFRDAGALAMAIGGSGGAGAVADNVSVSNDSLILTLGDDSDGILAQSLGGGGGAGGQAMTLDLQSSLPSSNKTSTTVTVAVGGQGGGGAISGDVSATNTGIIATTGDRSFGIRAQAIGGGGGVGGAVVGAHVEINGTNSSLDINVGGAGGNGNSAGNVDVLNEGLIYTTGIDAAGISANSIGGGGGDAGMIFDMSIAAGGEQSNSLRAVFNIGGNGGIGGTGGDVSVTNRPTAVADSGTIITEGNGAYGIFAQSLGGGGGNSSSIVSLTTVIGGKDSGTFGFNFGAIGGDGNSAGNVTVDNSGLIQTAGDTAHGVFAQSIGGGGGNGGLVVAGNINFSAPTSAPLIAIGGVGGDGADGGNVTVNNSGAILTTGANAHGIFAQSIGGGGGNASMGFGLTGEPYTLAISNALSAIIGATGGGTGGIGGNVTVNHSGDITVLGDGSQAIVAESINGGGGTINLSLEGITTLPGFAYGGTVDPAAAPDPLVIARAGASGSTDMNSGKVTINSSGTIGAGGDNGSGINLQAIGGGGGTINLRSSIVTLLSADYVDPQLPLAFSAVLGGTEGTNNGGGALDSSHNGAIITDGTGTAGLRMQSIGGGGGMLFLDVARQLSAQFGGANAAFGATNSNNSTGGAINHNQTGFIGTAGNFSPAAMLQSIGGGGGTGQIIVSDTPAAAPAAEPLSVADAPASNTQLRAAAPMPMTLAMPLSATTVTLGSVGGIGNNGDSVTGMFTGGFATSGASSTALIVQSIGAGGGYATVSGDDAPNIILGGSAGADGDGGSIAITNTGDFQTLGFRSHALVMQSIGGGGGAVFGDFTNPILTLNTDNLGDGSDISFVQSGNIYTAGEGSFGIIAQSLGGGGGFIDGIFAGSAGGAGSAGSVTLKIDGSVFTPGLDSTAVFAQSDGVDGVGNLTITASGNIRGGSGSGAGVQLAGGANNRVTIDGTLSAVSGLAMVSDTGNDRLFNNGITVGNLALGSGTNRVFNAEGATFVTIDSLDLQDGVGSSGRFTNAGNFMVGRSAARYPIDQLAGDSWNSPGMGIPALSDDPKTDLYFGTPVIGTVALDGDYVQTDSGHAAFDVAFGPYSSDRVNVTGNATVGGTLDVTLLWLENANPVTLFATGGSGLDNGLTVPGTIALGYNVLAGGNTIALAFKSDFGQPFLRPNEQQLGHHMDSALQVGGAAGIGRLMALLGNLTAGQEDTYADIFNELDPEALTAPSLTQFLRARDFSQQMFGCDLPLSPPETTCIWGKVGMHSTKRNSERGDRSFKQSDGVQLRLGVEQPVGDDVSIATTFGYDNIGDIRFDNGRATSFGNGIHAGLAVRKNFGSAGQGQMALSLSAGRQKNDLTRSQTIFVSGEGKSRYTTSYFQLASNVGYRFDLGKLFVRPSLDASVIGLRQHGFIEEGLQGLGMVGASNRDWIATVSPQLTLGANLTSTARISFTGGGVFHTQDAITHPFRFVGAPQASDPAMISTRFDQSAFMAGADIEVVGNSRLKVEVGYRGEFGKMMTSHTGNLDIRLLF